MIQRKQLKLQHSARLCRTPELQLQAITTNFRKMVEVTPTPQVTPTRQVPCQKTDCDKVYKARGTMLNHMRKHHKEVQSPLGTFPPSNSAVVLQFGDTEDAATQGNSHGAINSPKVTSVARYGCAVCDLNFETKEHVTKHMTDNHVIVAPVNQEVVDNDDDAANDEVEAELEQEEDFMEAAKEELEVFEALADLADNAFDPVTEKDKSRQVETHKGSLVNEKENELKAASNRFKNLEKELKTVKEQNKANIDSLNETVGSLTKRNNDLMTQIATEKSLAESNAEVEAEVEVHAEESIQRVDMRKDVTGHKCIACDRLFKASSDLDRHMRDKHEEHACTMCNNKFNSSKEAEEHICREGEIIPQVCEKSYCKKKFVSSNALAKHVKNAHFGRQRTVCTKCGEMLDKNEDMNKHIDTCGKEPFEEIPEKSREVCKHWKKGRCDRGSQCRFSHVGRQEKTSTQHKSTNSAVIDCRNGPFCIYRARGKCNFFHHIAKRHNSREQQGTNYNVREVQDGRNNNRERQGARHHKRGHQGPREKQGPRGQGRRQKDDRAPCRFGRDCDRVLNCPYIHSLEDFPMYNQSQGFRATKRTGKNRNRA